MLAGVGGKGSAEPGGICRIGRNPNWPNNYPCTFGKLCFRKSCRGQREVASDNDSSRADAASVRVGLNPLARTVTTHVRRAGQLREVHEQTTRRHAHTAGCFSASIFVAGCVLILFLF